MNAKKNKLYNVMKDIINKYYYVDKFERIDSMKKEFVENKEELLDVGKEIFDNFNLKKYKIKLFLDICAAPGMYSKILMDNDNTTTGIGISLPTEKGGVPFEIDYDKYKIFYKDILEKSYEIEAPKKIDFGIASCVSYVDLTGDAVKTFFLNTELILTSCDMILSNLEKNGNMIINLSMKNINLCYNIINILSKYFDEIKLWKSDTIWSTKNTLYLFAYGFKNNYEKQSLRNYVEVIKNKNSDILNRFIGTTKEYNYIDNMMNKIFIIRINSWLKLLANYQSNNDN